MRAYKKKSPPSLSFPLSLVVVVDVGEGGIPDYRFFLPSRCSAGARGGPGASFFISSFVRSCGTLSQAPAWHRALLLLLSSSYVPPFTGSVFLFLYLSYAAPLVYVLIFISVCFFGLPSIVSARRSSGLAFFLFVFSSVGLLLFLSLFSEVGCLTCHATCPVWEVLLIIITLDAVEGRRVDAQRVCGGPHALSLSATPSCRVIPSERRCNLEGAVVTQDSVLVWLSRR